MVDDIVDDEHQSKHGTKWDKMNAAEQQEVLNKLPALNDLDFEELVWIPRPEMAVAILVEEHNRVPRMHVPLTLRQQLSYFRKHLRAHRVTDVDDISTELQQRYYDHAVSMQWVLFVSYSCFDHRLSKFSGITDIYNLKRRAKVAICSNVTYESLMEFFKAYAK